MRVRLVVHMPACMHAGMYVCMRVWHVWYVVYVLYVMYGWMDGWVNE